MELKKLIKHKLFPALAGCFKFKTKVKLTPILDMKGSEEKWMSIGNDPAFLLEGKFFSGWNKVYWFAKVDEYISIKMYWDTGEGFSETNSQVISVIHPNKTEYEHLVYIPKDTVRLRIDPGENEAEFVFKRLSFVKTTKIGLLTTSFLKLMKQRGGSIHAMKIILIKAAQLYKTEGLRGIWTKAKKVLGIDSKGSSNDYQTWIYKNQITESDKENIKISLKSLGYQPLISIIVPVYNVDEIWLRKCIDSVINQYYQNWELCIADDASTKPHIKHILNEYMQKDHRIKVVFREINGHISESSNSALGLAEGEFIGLLDHDDELSENALYENIILLNRHPEADFIYSDEDKIDVEGKRHSPFFKPDWSPDLLLSHMYTCHFGLYRKEIVDKIGGFRKGYEGSQDYDLVLRFTEHTNAIYHIPKILYHWRTISESTASGASVKNYTHFAGKKALQDALSRRGIDGIVKDVENYSNMFYVHYNLKEKPLVSIIIPTKDMAEILDKCLKSIFDRTSYPNFEVIIIDNGSTENTTRDVFQKWTSKYPNKLRILQLDIPFNYSKLNNEAVKVAKGQFVVLLNNDIEVISQDWIEEMLGYAQRENTGAVGIKLLYPDNSIQHAGVILGIGGVAGHSHKYYSGSDLGYFSRLKLVSNYSAVTAACLMIRKSIFEEVCGLEEELKVAFNDIDFCLKVREKGYYNVCLTNVTMYHYESKSRGQEDSPQKVKRFNEEIDFMKQKWGDLLENDPFYNLNLTKEREDFGLNL